MVTSSNPLLWFYREWFHPLQERLTKSVEKMESKVRVTGMKALQL